MDELPDTLHYIFDPNGFQKISEQSQKYHLKLYKN